MEVTVIIPAYNAAATIAETIRSVLQQTHQPSEVVVVNDGSQDSTQVEVQKFGDRVRLINQKNQGVSAARNHGIALSKTEWVSFLDSDDTWLPEKLAEQAKLLAANPELDWCSTRYWVCGSPRFLSSYLSDKHLPEGNQHRIDALDAISTTVNIWVSTVVIKKEVVEAAGGFCTELSSTADNDLWIRVASKSREIGFVNQPLANYRLDPGSMSAAAGRSISASRYNFFDRLAEYIQNSDSELRCYYERIFDRYVGNYMFNVARSGNVNESRQLAQWLRSNNYRLPGWRYRWIHWVPSGLINFARKMRRKA